jgi:endonuclease YncB( thermonuclease family)
MGVSIIKWDAETAANRLRIRSRWRIAGAIAIGIFLLSILGDHLRAKNSFTDDWAQFDGRQVRFVRVIDGESIAVSEESSEDIISVKLLGIRPFDSPLDKGLVERVDSELAGKEMTLHLGPTQTRDDRGRLLADALTEDGKPVCAELVVEGLSLADRHSNSAFLAAIERAQTQARKRKAGMWAQ